MEKEREIVCEYLKREVEDWDDEEKSRSRFKGLSGQSGDYEWQCRYLFWKELIIKVARHLHTFIIRPHQLQHVWFRRGDLSPLCLDHVLVEMVKNGDLLRSSDLVDPKSGQLSQILRKVFYRVSSSRRRNTFNVQSLNEDFYILLPLLEEKSLQVVQLLSESHWTASCVITLNEFQQVCGGLKEASIILSHLTESGKAKYLSVRSKDIIEGVKVALASGAACGLTSLDYDVLHLLWTVERLEQQLNMIDSRYKMIKELASASLKSGNRTAALRHARELKLASQGREKCNTLLNRVEEVLSIISDAEASKKVSEAIVIGTRAIKENRISAEEVARSLEELDEAIASQKQVDKLLETTSKSGIEDEDIEDELQQLEIDIRLESTGIQVASETADGLSSTLSNLTLTEANPSKSVDESHLESTCKNVPETANLEAA